MDLRAYKIVREPSQVPAASVPAVFVVAPAPPPPQPLPTILALPPTAPVSAFAIARPSLGVASSPFRQSPLSSSSRLARSPYRQTSVAPVSAPPPPPPPPAPVLTAPASASSSMPRPYMQPPGFYLSSHARHHDRATIRPELRARLAFRRDMETKDAVFGQTAKDAVKAIDRAIGQQ